MMDDDYERRRFSLLMPGQQTLELFDMLRSVRGDIAMVMRSVIEFRTSLETYRAERELREKPASTEEKIETALEKRFNFGKWFMEKVLPNLVTFIVLALLMLAFQKP